ncbi:unnamed protein product [Effrenium voratum]|uniref:Uncharacterized protein n=1 Tax=Effrenium voratum TaxID=2562239 RepID=A0AA36N519_9DINO|nr:unnamed protein product [Effrenium voratum]
MAPKKQSVPENKSLPEIQDDQEEQELSELLSLLCMEDAMDKVAGSSTDTVQGYFNRVNQEAKKMMAAHKMLKQELSTREKMIKKAIAKAKSEANATIKKQEKAMKRLEMKNITVLFNGQRFMVPTWGAMTVGMLRKHLVVMWNTNNSDRPIANVRATKLAVLHNMEKLHLKPRATLGSFKLSEDMVLHVSFMADEDEDAASSLINDDEQFEGMDGVLIDDEQDSDEQ